MDGDSIVSHLVKAPYKQELLRMHVLESKLWNEGAESHHAHALNTSIISARPYPGCFAEVEDATTRSEE
jgi:hypothetical protein